MFQLKYNKSFIKNRLKFRCDLTVRHYMLFYFAAYATEGLEAKAATHIKIIDVLMTEIAGAYFLTTPQKTVSIAIHFMYLPKHLDPRKFGPHLLPIY